MSRGAGRCLLWSQAVSGLPFRLAACVQTHWMTEGIIDWVGCVFVFTQGHGLVALHWLVAVGYPSICLESPKATQQSFVPAPGALHQAGVIHLHITCNNESLVIGSRTKEEAIRGYWEPLYGMFAICKV